MRREGGIYVPHDGLMTGEVLRLVRGMPRRSWIPRVVNEVLGELTAAGFRFPDPSQVFQAWKVTPSPRRLTASSARLKGR